MDHNIETNNGTPYCVGCSYGRHEDCVQPCGCDATCEVWPGRDWELKHRAKTSEDDIVHVPNVFPEDWL